MQYPARLLPKRNYKKFKTEMIPRGVSLICAARSDKLFDDLGEVRVDAIVKRWDEYYNQSLNHFGMSKREDIFIKITDKEIRYKRWETPVDCSVESNQWTTDNSRKPLFLIEVHEIHNTPFPDQVRPVNNNDKSFTGKCLIEHDPMHYNFWHFEIRYYADGKLIDPKTRSTWKRDFAIHCIEVFIKNYFVADQPKETEVPKECYIQDY